MNYSRLLGEQFGGWWAGVRFDLDSGFEGERTSRTMRFCEAVTESRSRPIVLTPEALDCAGGRWSMGWGEDAGEVARAMAEKLSIGVDVTSQIVSTAPKLAEQVEAVTVGTDNFPDVIVSYAQPQAAMRLLHTWQQANGKNPIIQLSSFMTVCGSVAVGAYLSGRICVSFGCPDAREYGRIGRDRLIVGLPSRIAPYLVSGQSSVPLAAH